MTSDLEKRIQILLAEDDPANYTKPLSWPEIDHIAKIVACMIEMEYAHEFKTKD